ALLVDERPHIDDAFAASDLALDDPIERTAVGEFLGTLGDHACRVDMLGLLAAALFVLKPLLDPALEVFDGIATDAKFDQIEGHFGLSLQPQFCGAGTIVITLAPSATCAFAATAMPETSPSIGAVSVCSIFIASMMARRWPRVTGAPSSTSNANTLPCMGARTMPPLPP